METLAARLTLYDRHCIPTSTHALTRGTYNHTWHQTVKQIPQKPCRRALSRVENTSPIACVGIASPVLTTGEDAASPWVDVPLDRDRAAGRLHAPARAGGETGGDAVCFAFGVVLPLARPFLVTLHTLLEVRRGGVLKAVSAIAHPRSLTHNPATESSLDHCAAKNAVSVQSADRHFEHTAL